ncbi:MAG TPA: Do family serine endopeptidase [Burkholderiales bacterium]|jgi:Do/DeqQ family serine protease|nr:Do family serine endopeptidase [Burkholderiales bacterium]
MLHRLWLVFAQTATVCLAALFVVATLKPEWLPQRGDAAKPPAAAPGEAAIAPIARGPAAAPRAESFHDAVLRSSPAVVNIFTSKEIRAQRSPLLNDPLFRRFFGDQFGDETQRATNLGSGVIVSPAGYILTNHHVVETADEIEVALSDGKKLLAKVVGNDPETDLAVLRVNADKLPAITFGQSEQLRVGDVVLAIGNPFGVGQTVTSGIVSAIGRSGLHINTFENFIQTDAAINPGNSGGALVDVQGNLVGINTAIYSRTGGSMGIGFAIPVSTARMVMDQIIKSGSVTRGWIGVELQEITPAIAESFKLADTRGAIIAGVLRGGPADKAGVKPGDVLTSVNDAPVADPQAMLNLVAALQPGSSARVKVKRQAQTLELAVTVGRRPKPQPRE